MTRRRRAFPDLVHAWLLATLLSGIPSTTYALLTGNDPLEATRAAGAMIGRPDSIAAAAIAVLDLRVASDTGEEPELLARIGVTPSSVASGRSKPAR
jgi:hypothetical protein